MSNKPDESLKLALSEQGIVPASVLKKNATIQMDCPQGYCKDSRAILPDEEKEARPLELRVLEGGYAEWKCRHCCWAGHVGTDPRIAPDAPEPEIKLPTERTALSSSNDAVALRMPPEIIEYFTVRSISPEVLDENGIYWDEESQTIVFPHKNKDGKRINAMHLKLPEQTTYLENRNHFVFYGIDKANHLSPTVIVQTEMGRLILQTAGVANVIALPNAGHLPPSHEGRGSQADNFDYFVHAAPYLDAAQRVLIALDNTPEGDYFREEITRRIGAAKCELVKWSRSSIGKTFREMGIDGICDDIRASLPVPIYGLYEVRDFENSLMTYFEGGMASGVSTGWSNVDELYTVALGELTVVSGIPNSGKSEWLDALTINLALRQGWRFAIFSPENGKEVHTTKLIEKRVELPSDPNHSNRMSLDTFINGASWVQNHYNFIVADRKEGRPTLDWILEKASEAVLRYGIKGLIIDPWNRIAKNLKGASETDYVAEALDKILLFCSNHNVHVWLVAHPAKQEPDKRTKQFSAPSIYSIAGSAHFANMADNCIVIHRSASIDDSTEVWVRKIRFKHVGTTGDTLLVYNRDTGRFAEQDMTTPTYTATELKAPKKDKKQPEFSLQTIRAPK